MTGQDPMSYAGDVPPSVAFATLRDVPGAVLVDVRTAPELAFVGRPDLSSIGKQVVHVVWQRYPDDTVNEHFGEQLTESGLDPSQPILFICRSGNRSVSAAQAATRAGYEQAYNVAEGFEGPLDESGHRGTRGGWKVAGLPWRQP
jgi:rhodanese-related sulfurtransferase